MHLAAQDRELVPQHQGRRTTKYPSDHSTRDLQQTGEADATEHLPQQPVKRVTEFLNPTRHARELVSLERSPHLFVEGNMQHAAHALPGLTSPARPRLTLHLAVTAGVLLWLHQRRPAAFPFVRTTLLLASGVALVGFLVYPTAPPRLAGIGIADTVSNGHIDLNSGLVSSLYNPSLHVDEPRHLAAAEVLVLNARRRTRRAASRGAASRCRRTRRCGRRARPGPQAPA